jgi:hypothetical protein
VILFLVICGTPHNSSRLESYGHVKLEKPHKLSKASIRSKKLNYSRRSQKKLTSESG